MRWISTEKEGEIKYVIIAESRAIWPRIVRRKIKQE